MKHTDTTAAASPAGPGEAAQRIREHDWAATPLGAAEGWPDDLRKAVEARLAEPPPAPLTQAADGGGRRLIDGTMRDAEAHFRSLAELVPTLLWRTDPSGREVSLNPGWLEYTGQTLEQTQDGGWLAAIHPQDRETTRRVFEQAYADDRPLEVQHRIRRHDGQHRWFLIRQKPLRDPTGRTIGWFGAATDVHEQRVALDLLRASQQRQLLLLSLLQKQRETDDPDAVMAAAAEAAGAHLGADRAGFFELAGPEQAVWRAGWSAGQLPVLDGSAPLASIGEEHLAELRAGRTVAIADTALDPLTAGSPLARSDVRAGIGAPIHRGGRWAAGFYVNQAAVRDWSPEEVQLAREIADQTWDAVERARAVGALRSSEERLRAIVDQARDYAIFTTDRENRIESWTPGAEAVFGWTADEAAGQPSDITFTPEDQAAEAPAKEFAAAREAGQTPNVRWHLHKDGRRVFIDGVARARHGPSGEFQGLLKIGRDVTERRRLDEELQESEARFREFAENSADTLYVVDAQAERLEYLSPAYERMWGESRDAVTKDLGRWAELVHPDDREAARTGLPRAKAGETAIIEYRIRRRSDGAVRWIRDTGFPMRDAEGRVRRIGGIAQDVTDIKWAESEILRSRERLRLITGHLPQLVWTAVADGLWTWAGPQWTAYTGQSEPDSHGRRWLEAVHPEDHQLVREAWSAAGDGGELDVEYRIRRASDGSFRWFHTRATPLWSEEQEEVEWFGGSTDVDDMRRLRDRQEVLVAELQHRTRNLLGVVRAVARQTRRASASLDDFETRFGERLAALGRVQGLLSRSDDRPVLLSAVLRMELAAHGADDDPRAALEGPEVKLPPRAVQTLALAFHELTTNALKHGALSRPQGRLAVTWTTADGVGGPRLVLRWREDGIGPRAGDGAEVRRGYGRELIERALPYELGARTSLAFPDDGVRCEIELPVNTGEDAG